MLYEIWQEWTSREECVGQALSLADAKRIARRAYDRQPSQSVVIRGDHGFRIDATQTHGRGFIWD